MKIILLRDVVGVGQKGQIKDVSDGFAMNRLLPQKAAVVATPEKLKELKAGEMARALAAQEQEKQWHEHARLLKDAKVTVRVEANDQGHLYQQLSVASISDRVKKELGVDVAAESVLVKGAIKSLGRADAEIKLGNKRVPLTVFVEREN